MAFREEIIGDCRLILGDCLEAMPTLEPVDLVVTDPPYIGLSGGQDIRFNKGVAKSHAVSRTVGDEWGASMEWFAGAWHLASYGMITFCSWHSVDLVRSAARDSAVKRSGK